MKKSNWSQKCRVFLNALAVSVVVAGSVAPSVVQAVEVTNQDLDTAEVELGETGSTENQDLSQDDSEEIVEDTTVTEDTSVATATADMTTVSEEGATQAAADGERTITVLGTTDVHGNLWDYSYEDNKPADVGLARISTMAKQIRAENEDMLLIDNGDMVQGTILTDDMYNVIPDLQSVTHPMIAGMNYMGYDSMTLGNHEFNFGLGLIERIQADAKFPILSANTVNKADGTPYVKEYIVKDLKDGLKVGVVGLTIPHIPLWDGAKVDSLEFKGLTETAQAVVAEMKDPEGEDCDIVIASIHAGRQNTDEQAAAFNVMDNVPEIDAYLLGHDHSSYTNETDGFGRDTIYGGVKDTGAEALRIDLDVKEVAEGEWEVDQTSEKSGAQILYSKDYVADQGFLDATQSYHDNTQNFISTEIGQASADFLPTQEIAGIPEALLRPTAMISLINNVQREVTGAQIAAGALFKEDSALPAGPLTYANVFDIYKYPNTLVKTEITGANLKKYMENQAAFYQQYQPGDVTISFEAGTRVYNYDIFSGIDYKIDISKPVGERIVSATIDGQPINDGATYTIAMNNYRYTGLVDSKVGIISPEAPTTDTDPDTLRGEIVKYIREKGTINPEDEIEENWEVVGADLNHYLRPYILTQLANPNNTAISIQKSEDGRTPNVKRINVNDLYEQGHIPDEAVLSAISDQTTVQDITDAKTVTGTTIPNAALTITKETATRAVSSIPATSDADGKFSVDISSLEAASGDLIKVAVAGLGGTEVVVTKTIGAVSVQMLGINDFHGALSTKGTFTDDNNNRTSNSGTAALLASYLNYAESKFSATTGVTDGTVRLQAGDMVGASPANSGLLQDEPTIKIMNALGIEISTLGNHEFDEGLGEFDRIWRGVNATDADGFLDVVKDYNVHQEAANSELVIANVVEKSTGKVPFNWAPYTVKEVNGVKIGYIGVVTTDIPNLVLKEHWQGYDFLDEAETITKYSKELRNDGVNAIVVVGHVDANSKDNVASGKATAIMDKVDELDKDNSVDAFFAAHNHYYTNGLDAKGDTRIVQSTAQGKGYVDLQGELDLDKQDFTSVPDATVNAVDPVFAAANGIVPDADVAAIVEIADQMVEPVVQEKIGTASERAAADKMISRGTNEFGESPVGNLITDGQVYMANQADLKDGDTPITVDFAMTNNGGIRADLAVREDKAITWGAAQSVQPFGNIMQIVKMTGAQIRTVLNQQTFTWNAEAGTSSGMFLQTAGLKYTVTDNPEADPTHPWVVAKLSKIDGTPILDDEDYYLVINDFLLGGGDGFAEFTNSTLVGAMDPDTETFVNYIKDRESQGIEIDAQVEGRKTYKSAEELTAEAIAAITEATTLDMYREGGVYLTGVTLPLATVTVGTTEPAGRATLPSSQANAEGRFSIDVSSLELKEGDKVTVTVTDADGYSAPFELTVAAKEAVNPDPEPDPGEAAIKAIKDNTKLNELREGDQHLTGKTVASATIAVTLKGGNGTVITTVAAADGQFKIDVRSLELKKGDQLVVTITDAKGYSVPFDVTVAAKAQTGGNNTNDGTSNGGGTSNGSNTTGSGKNFPSTGDSSNQTLIVIGFTVIAAAGAVYVFKRKSAA